MEGRLNYENLVVNLFQILQKTDWMECVVNFIYRDDTPDWESSLIWIELSNYFQNWLTTWELQMKQADRSEMSGDEATTQVAEAEEEVPFNEID